jgi:hypothetical protein
VFWGDLNVSHHGSADKAILQSTKLWILFWVDDLDIQQFDVEILIYTVQRPCQDNIILEFNGDFFSNQGFEE